MRRRITREIGHHALLDELRELLETDFATTTEAVAQQLTESEKPLAHMPGVDLQDQHPHALPDIDARMVNGKVKDALDYAEYGSKGLNVIAIGGDELARGLPL